MNKEVQQSYSPTKRLPGPFMAITIQARTFQGIRQDHEQYIASGAVKHKVAEFNNCENPVMIKVTVQLLHTFHASPHLLGPRHTGAGDN